MKKNHQNCTGQVRHFAFVNRVLVGDKPPWELAGGTSIESETMGRH